MASGTGEIGVNGPLRTASADRIIEHLKRAGGRIYGEGGAAERLGINPTTLASRLRALEIAPPKPR